MQTTDDYSCDIGVQHYATRLGVYDEMYAKTDKVLPYWEQFLSSLENLGAEELERRRREAQRLLRDNGVTYNVYGDTQNLTRPWQLDPVPLLISSEEWAVIEAGLIQRATLLDLVLKDIYGEQTLIKKGLLPLELVYGHEGFLRPCVGALSKHQRHLIIYSANLARGPNGRMWVVDDRTQAPSGSGYALENRSVITRVLPEIFRESQVHRLSGFFRNFCQGLAHIAPHNKENPRIVVLTPGPLNETYFEHAFLASFLGYTLVQGDDLTVRDGRVWVKSLEGLQPVDVILRRTDDSFCDPLELKSSSRLGVTGLLEVVRRNNVALANPLGSSILENHALLAFLPELARYFLDEELLLPSAATWWCGQTKERDFVLQNLQRLVIKPTNRSQGNVAVFGASLSNQETETLRTAILAKPHLFVGQEQISFSTVPAFVKDHIEPRNAVLRNFVVAGESGYHVMPGGLTRISLNKDNFIVSNQTGGISKDTWILAAEPDKHAPVSFNPAKQQVIAPVTEPLSSRAADHLFWVGRSLERIEAAARLLRSLLFKYQETLEFKDADDIACLNVLLSTLTHITGTYPGFVEGDKSLLLTPREELLALAKDSKRSGSLAANIQNFAYAAFSIRDLWSQDTWRSVDHIQRCWQQQVINRDITVEQLQDYLDDLITGIVAFSGLTNESMTREKGWLMLDSGRRLERALALVALLRSALVSRHDDSIISQVLEAVLVTTDSLSIYQRRYRSLIRLPMVLELLMMDETHPRSLAFQLKYLCQHVSELPRQQRKGQLSEEERLVLKAYTDLRLVKVIDLMTSKDGESVHSALDQLLSDISRQLWHASEVIAEAYFSHAQGPQQMAPTLPEEES